MKSHRCKEMLEYNKNTYKPCNIRYESWLPNYEPEWILSSLEYDYEGGNAYMWRIAKVKYCPFCGRKLENEIN